MCKPSSGVGGSSEAAAEPAAPGDGQERAAPERQGVEDVEKGKTAIFVQWEINYLRGRFLAKMDFSYKLGRRAV